MRTDQVVEAAIKTIKKLSTDEKAKLRARINRQLVRGSVQEGSVDAAN